MALQASAASSLVKDLTLPLNKAAGGARGQCEQEAGRGAGAGNRVQARRYIALLGAPADLDGALVVAAEDEEVVGLEDLVAELGVREASVRASQPGLDGLFGDHRPDRELLAHVPKERDDVELGEPRVVVEELGATGSLEIDEAGHLALELFRPGRHLLLGVERAFSGLAARIADEPRAATDQHDGSVAVELEAAEGEQRQQAARVQALGGRVEAAIDRAGAPRQMGIQLAGIGHVGDESAGLEIAEQRCSHGCRSSEHYLTAGGRGEQSAPSSILSGPGRAPDRYN